MHQFGLVSAGRSRLLVDGRPVVDAWDRWQPGQNYFGEGNDEAIGTRELEAGRTHEIVVEYAANPNRRARHSRRCESASPGRSATRRSRARSGWRARPTWRWCSSG